MTVIFEFAGYVIFDMKLWDKCSVIHLSLLSAYVGQPFSTFKNRAAC